jgi:hypothetical protein
MLRPYLDQKAVLAYGPRLPPRLIEYVLTEDWSKATHAPDAARLGRPSLISDPEILTLAILAQWPRFRSERDFWRFANAHLREYFPALPSQSQFNRRARALEAEMKALWLHLAGALAEPSAVYHDVLDTTLIPAIVRVRACRRGLFSGQASFGRCASKTEWVYGFKVGLSVTPEGVITTFCLAEASAEERPVGEILIRSERHAAYTSPRRASPRLSGSDTGSRSTGLWWRPPRRRTPRGSGTPREGCGRWASARSSRGS